MEVLVNMDYAITTFAPFVFTWQRTQEIFELLRMGYVFPALADAILLPDMFGYKYNNPEDGNTQDERHYKGWCKENLSRYEHPVGTDVIDYNLLNPTLYYKIRNFVVHGTKITADGKDDLNRLFCNKQSKVGKQFDEVEFRLCSAIFVDEKGQRIEGWCNEDELTVFSSVRSVKENKLFVCVSAFALCLKLIRCIDVDYKNSTEAEQQQYNANYLCHRRIVIEKAMNCSPSKDE